MSDIELLEPESALFVLACKVTSGWGDSGNVQEVWLVSRAESVSGVASLIGMQSLLSPSISGSADSVSLMGCWVISLFKLEMWLGVAPCCCTTYSLAIFFSFCLLFFLLPDLLFCILCLVHAWHFFPHSWIISIKFKLQVQSPQFILISGSNYFEFARHMCTWTHMLYSTCVQVVTHVLVHQLPFSETLFCTMHISTYKT